MQDKPSGVAWIFFWGLSKCSTPIKYKCFWHVPPSMVLWVWFKLVNFKLWTCHVWWTIHVQVKLFPLLQPFCSRLFSNSQSQHFNLWKRAACVWQLGKGMLETPVPQGLDQPLQQGDDEWWPGKTLTTNSPSWMWKTNRKHLAKGDNKNKAGKKLGKGTTSNIRKLQRLHLQDKQPEENSWERGGWENSWERGEWEDSWERDGWIAKGFLVTLFCRCHSHLLCQHIQAAYALRMQLFSIYKHVFLLVHTVLEWVAYKSPMPLKTQVLCIFSAYALGFFQV